VAFRAAYRLAPPGGEEPSATDVEAARLVVDSLVASIGYADYAVVAQGSTIYIYLPASGDPESVRAVLRPAGDFRFVPVPAGTSVESGDPAPMAAPLFGREGVASATLGLTPTGERAVDLTLTEQAAAILDEWAADHQGAQLAVVAGGRVILAPTIMATRFGGRLQVSGPNIDVQPLLAVMRAPPLPAPLEEVESRPVERASDCI
jgi:preprotein translocase subunit SecD